MHWLGRFFFFLQIQGIQGGAEVEDRKGRRERKGNKIRRKGRNY